MTQIDTKEAILDAAERLFGAWGYQGTSLRQLTAAAGVNLAAVHYHFGSKARLAAAVLARRIDPINAERLRRLEQVTAEVDDRRIEPRDIMRAFVEPALESSRGSPDATGMCRMFGRILAEQPPFLTDFLRERFRVIGERFSAALRRALPGLSQRDVLWRLHFTVGALAHTMQHALTLQEFSGGLCDPSDLDEVADRLVEFVTDGMASRPGMRLPRAEA